MSPRDEIGNGGIIPAGAGKSYIAITMRKENGDHPRGCGEKEFHGWIPFGEWGSSPRVRGKEDP